MLLHSLGVTPIPNQSAPSDRAAAPKPTLEQLKTLIETSLEDDKAEDIVAVPLKGKTDIADYMIIASGRSQRHVSSIADKLADRLLEAGVRGVPVEGKDSCDWVLVDAGDIIVHLFRPEIRHLYNLEKMWAVENVPAGTSSPGVTIRTAEQPSLRA